MDAPGTGSRGTGAADPPGPTPAQFGLRRVLGRLLGPASAYWSSHALGAGIGFLMLPVLTRHLSPEDYGLVAMFTLVTAVADPLLGLNVAAAVSRRYYSLPGGEFARYVGTCLSLVLGASAVGLLLALALEAPLAALTWLPRGWLLAALLIAPINAVFFTATAVLQVTERPWSFVALSLGRTLAAAALILWLVLGRGEGWEGRAGGTLLSSVLILPVSLLVLSRLGALRPALDASHSRHALAYGVPLIPHVLGGVAMSITDRLLVAHLVDLGSAGLYAVGLQVAMLVTMLQDGFNKAWVPWLFARLGTAGAPEKVRLVRLTYAYDAALIGLALVLCAALPWLLGLLVPARFDGAWPFARWLMLAFAFDGAYKMAANYIFYAEKTHLLAAVTFLAAVLNVPLTWGLIRLHGPVGAAQATALVSLLMWLATWALSARCYPMPWWRALRGGASS